MNTENQPTSEDAIATLRHAIIDGYAVSWGKPDEARVDAILANLTRPEYWWALEAIMTPAQPATISNPLSREDATKAMTLLLRDNEALRTALNDAHNALVRAQPQIRGALVAQDVRYAITKARAALDARTEAENTTLRDNETLLKALTPFAMLYDQWWDREIIDVYFREWFLKQFAQKIDADSFRDHLELACQLVNNRDK